MHTHSINEGGNIDSHLERLNSFIEDLPNFVKNNPIKRAYGQLTHECV